MTTNPIPIKAALKLVGRDCGPPRLPLVEADAAETQVISEALERFGLLEGGAR